MTTHFVQTIFVCVCVVFRFVLMLKLQAAERKVVGSLAERFREKLKICQARRSLKRSNAFCDEKCTLA